MKTSLVWIAFWGFLWLQASAAQLTEDCLVAVSNRTDGTSVILDCGADTSTAYEALLEDQYLSPLTRPPRALVTHNTSTTNQSSFAIFLPLLNAQGVLELTYGKTDGWAHNLTVINVDCRVISVHKVQETYFTACLDSNEELAIYQLYINITNLNVAYAQRSGSVASGNSFSNIVYATLQDGQRHFYRLFVVIGCFIYQISPLDYKTDLLGGSLPSNSCHTLEYAGYWVLLATCTDSGETYSVYYDINDERVLNTTQGTDTVLFLCPPSEGRLTVNNTEGVVQYRNWSSSADTEFILHGNVHSGVCFGDSKMGSLSFAYSNDEAGVYVINISHGVDNDVQLSSNACLKQNCQSVFTLDKYLVVQEREHNGTVVTQVRDPTMNYSIEFEDVAGIALINRPQLENNASHNATNNDPHNTTNSDPQNTTNSDPQNITNSDPRNTTNSDPRNTTNNIIIITVVPVVCAIIIPLAVSFTIVLIVRCCRGKVSHAQYTIDYKEWHPLSPMIPRNKREDDSEEREPCPDDGQPRPSNQRPDATGGSQTTSIAGSNETMTPVPCTEPHNNPQMRLTQGHIAPEEGQSTVEPVPESRRPVIHTPARGRGDGAEENYHPNHDQQTN